MTDRLYYLFEVGFANHQRCEQLIYLSTQYSIGTHCLQGVNLVKHVLCSPYVLYISSSIAFCDQFISHPATIHGPIPPSTSDYSNLMLSTPNSMALYYVTENEAKQKKIVQKKKKKKRVVYPISLAGSFIYLFITFLRIYVFWSIFAQMRELSQTNSKQPKFHLSTEKFSKFNYQLLSNSYTQQH